MIYARKPTAVDEPVLKFPFKVEYTCEDFSSTAEIEYKLLDGSFFGRDIHSNLPVVLKADWTLI